MNFSFKITSVDLRERIIYSDSGEFDCFPNLNTDIIILIQYLNIGFDSQDNRAKQIWGLNHYKSWISKKLMVPESQKGELYISGDFNPGDSKRLNNYKNGTYFDPESGWVCVGDDQILGECDNIEFLKNVIATIKDGSLKALWIHPEWENNDNNSMFLDKVGSS